MRRRISKDDPARTASLLPGASASPVANAQPAVTHEDQLA
jgi:hypothetical protein